MEEKRCDDEVDFLIRFIVGGVGMDDVNWHTSLVRRGGCLMKAFGHRIDQDNIKAECGQRESVTPLSSTEIDRAASGKAAKCLYEFGVRFVAVSPSPRPVNLGVVPLLSLHRGKG
jgi:hypothetical protein